MENYINRDNDEQLSKYKLINKSNSSMSREEFNNLNEEHILSLRKKRGNKNIEHLKKMNLNAQLLTHDIDIKKLILLIQNDNIYIKYNSNENNENDKLNYLLQMLISEDINILKYSLIELKKYINNIKDSNEFNSKNLLLQFNDKMYRFLFNLLLKNKNNYPNTEDYYQIIILLCFIISKLCIFNDFYIGILLDYFSDLLNLAKNEQDKNVKSTIYIVTHKILLINKLKDNISFNKKLEEIYNNYFNQIYDELIQLNNESINNKNIFFIKDLYPTLINILSSIIYTNMQIYKNKLLIDLKKISHVLFYAKQYLSSIFMETDILKGTLHFLSVVLNYYKENKLIFEKESDMQFTEIINKIKLDKHIITYIYDNSMNDYDFRNEIIEMINNMLVINDSEFINNLIENNICEQISNLQIFLLDNEYENNNNNIIKILYKSHIELIYNLISTQSDNVIQNICIENSCISNLFQFINNSTFLYNNDNLRIIEIFDLIIESKTEFVHSLLLTEGISDLYKNILVNCKDNNLLLIILKDFSIMIERGKNIRTSNGINVVSNHFLKNGILDLINNIKSRSDLNNKIIFLLEEIPKLLDERTKN